MSSQQVLLHRPLPGARLNLAHPLARHLVLCMNFNEQGSRAMDLSPYGAHGRLSGFGSPAKRHFGGVDFNYTTPSYIEIPSSHTQLDFTSEELSIVARIKFDVWGFGARVIFCRGENNTDGYLLYGMQQFLVFATFQSGASQESDSYSDLLVGNSYTTGLSRSGATDILFCINGVDRTSIVNPHTDPTTCSRSAKIGIWDDKSSFPFDGKMEFLYIFGGIALSTSEHKAIHENPYAPYGYSLFL